MHQEHTSTSKGDPLSLELRNLLLKTVRVSFGEDKTMVEATTVSEQFPQ